MVLRPRTGSVSCRLSLCGRNFKTRAMSEYDDRVRYCIQRVGALILATVLTGQN